MGLLVCFRPPLGQAERPGKRIWLSVDIISLCGATAAFTDPGDRSMHMPSNRKSDAKLFASGGSFGSAKFRGA
jgi:hypothetical protein